MSEKVLFKRLLDDLAKIRSAGIDVKAWQTWRTDTSLSLGKVFGAESGNLRIFERMAQTLDQSCADAASGKNVEAFHKGLDSISVILKSSMASMEEDDEETEEEAEPSAKAKVMLPEIAVLCEPSHPVRKALFDFLKPFQVQVTFLREHTNYRQVPLEHMLNWKRVGFCVIFWDGDARTSFETGYLIGRLGMKQVAAISTQELPSVESFAHAIRSSGGDDWKAPLDRALRDTGYVPAVA